MRDAWSFTGRISIPFFFSPPPPSFFFFFFFGTSSAQPAYDFCVMHQCAPLLIHETYKSIPSKQFSSLSFHLVIHVTPFRNHYGSIKRNVISWKKKIYIYHTDGYFFSCNIYFTEINYIRRGTCDLIVLKFLSIFISLIYRNKSLAYIQSLLFEYTTISPK